MENRAIIKHVAIMLVVGALVAACSSTSSVPEDDQLYVGLEKIKYANYTPGKHFDSTQEEVEAALATAPNGSFFGSSYIRTAPYALWIYNAFAKDSTTFGQWIRKTFGKPPVLMSWVNPSLRASVAQEVVRSHGYFRGSVDYKVVEQHNPKKAKIAYSVNMGPLFTIDSLSYVNFPYNIDTLLLSHQQEAKIHKGSAFDVSSLDAERTRVGNLLRNNGYYFYQPDYATYLADTVSTPGKAMLQFRLADSLDSRITRKWYMGRIQIEYRKKYGEPLLDSIRHRNFTTRFNGRKPPIRTRVVARDIKLRRRQMYSYDNYLQSANLLSSTGLFSTVDFKFTPRDTTATCDTLDLTLNCVFDKPYDFYIEANASSKTNGKTGPELVVGLTRRNAFRGGENLNINVHGSYEWQTSHSDNGNSSKVNSYEYGADASVEFPRLMLPMMRRRRFYTTPTTTLKASTNTINRAGFFKRHIVSGELTYKFQPTATSIHEVSPLTMEYEYMQSTTKEFDRILQDNPYIMMSMQDQFIPKVRYTYTYTSPESYLNPIYWQTTVSESANLVSLGYMAFGHKWAEKDKKMFKNPYAQFVKIETDFRKTWYLGSKNQLVGHVNGGIILSYGNSDHAPYSEQFYVGGANSVRAFNVRSLGPGSYHTDVSRLSYMDQTGDIKLVANLEYRPHLFGNLYGALFVDAGNIWALRDDGYRKDSQFKLNKIGDQIALGTGLGLRYDLEFFVIRVDWGFALHTPYDTGKRGYFNMPNFRDSQSLHFAIGYPF